MKLKTLILVGLLLVDGFLSTDCAAQGIAINESGNAPNSCAILEVQPDVNFNKGLLLPRLTTAQRNTIAAPVAGLIVYNTTTSCFDIYNGSIWYSLGCQCSGAPVASVATAASSVGSGSFTANWGSVAGTSTFYLDVATDAAFTAIIGGYNNLNVGNVTNYSVTGLNCNTAYYYRLRAANPCGTSANSNTITLTTASTAPTVPTASAGTSVTGSSYTANWNNTGGTAYYLDVATDAAFTSFVSGFNNLNVGNVTSYSITGLGCSSTFYFRIRALNSCGTSASSNTISTTTSAAAPSAATANAATSVTGGSFYANWTTVSGITAYFLDVATDAGFASLVAGYSNRNVGTVVTYNVTGLNCNTTYYYRVRAGNGCGSSANSSTITTATGSTAASTPTASSASSVAATSFTANWGAVGSATQYFLDVATDVGFTAMVAGYNNLNVGNVTTVNVTGLSCVNVYYYRVRADNPCGTSSSSNTITVTPGNGCSALYSYIYKIPVTITNGGGALTNYQVKITLNTQALISGGKMQSGGEDIRITDADKCTLLSFWIETGTINTTTTVLWVKVPSLAAGTQMVYVYYGNGAATTVSDGANTFSFFDDFTGVALNAAKWTATGATSVAAGRLTITTGCVYSNATVASQPGFITESKLKWNGLANNYCGMGIANAQVTSGGNGGSNKLVYYMTDNASANVVSFAGSGTAASYNIGVSNATQFTAVAGTDYIIGDAVSGTNVIYYKDRTSLNSYAGTWSAAYYIFLGYFTGSSSGTTNISDGAFDWVLVRQYAATVPTTVNSAEENGCL